MKRISVLIIALLFSVAGYTQKLGYQYTIDSVTSMDNVNGKETSGINGYSCVFTMEQNVPLLFFLNGKDTIVFKAVKNLETVALSNRAILKKFVIVNMKTEEETEFGLYINGEGNIRGIAFRKEESVIIFWIKQDIQLNEQ